MLVVTTSFARRDIIESAEFIAKDNSVEAVRFLDAVENTITLITSTPSIGRLKPVGGQKNLRMWFVKDFAKHLIFYKATKTELRIIRIIYSSRDYKAVFSDKIQNNFLYHSLSFNKPNLEK